MILQQLIAFGCIGILVEVFFTGLYSAFQRNWRLTSQTYLWMFPIYATGGLQLDALHALDGNPFLMAALYVPVIFANEFLWGLLLHKLTGKKIWDYGPGSRTVLGFAKQYIKPAYAPFWWLLGLGFELYADRLARVLRMISTV